MWVWVIRIFVDKCVWCCWVSVNVCVLTLVPFRFYTCKLFEFLTLKIMTNRNARTITVQLYLRKCLLSTDMWIVSNTRNSTNIGHLSKIFRFFQKSSCHHLFSLRNISHHCCSRLTSIHLFYPRRFSPPYWRL